MLKFLLWNLNKKPLQASVAALAYRHDVDVIVLLENEIAPDLLKGALNSWGENKYDFSSSACFKVHIFSKFPHELIRPIYESDRLTVRHLKLPGKVDILLAAVHFISKRNYSDPTQAFECVYLANEIIQAEKQVGHTRTILAGDLNMNPFDIGVISAGGLHATMSRVIAQRGSRIVRGKAYPFFYNPMWNLLGDATPGPAGTRYSEVSNYDEEPKLAGTYYYSDSNHDVLFWNMFDQVLLRPELISVFDHRLLQILDTDGERSFLSKQWIPSEKYGSDHLPVLFGLDL